MKKKFDSAYDFVAYKVSSEDYKVVTLVRRSDRSVFRNMHATVLGTDYCD